MIERKRLRLVSAHLAPQMVLCGPGISSRKAVCQGRPLGFWGPRRLRFLEGCPQ
jgi:hypothetical protein